MRTSIVLRAKIAEAIVDKILKALEKSTLHEQHPAAYHMLVGYREDMETTTMQVLGWRKWL